MALNSHSTTDGVHAVPPNQHADDIGFLDLAHVFDIPAIQRLMDVFYDLTHIGVALVDLKGQVLVATGWQDICTHFHRVHPEAAKYCIESDTSLVEDAEPGTVKLYRCKNNMWDMATPIMVGGKHLGNLFLGQFFFDDEPDNREMFRQQARRYGFDETEYIAAYDRVPRWSREKVNKAMRFYVQLAELIGYLGYGNLKVAETLAEYKCTQEQLLHQDALLQVLTRMATDFINTPLDEVDHALDDLLETLGEFTNMDRVYIFEHNHARQTTSCTKEWCAEGVSQEKDNLQEFPFAVANEMLETLSRGEAFIVPNVAEMRADDPMQTEFERQGIQTLVALPLMRSGTCMGFVGFDSVSTIRVFEEKDVYLLKVASGIITNSMIQKESEERLRDMSYQLQELTRHLQDVRESECRHIAVWLHDEIGQMLTRARLDAMLLNRLSEGMPPKAVSSLSSLRNTLDDAITAIQALCIDLRPVMLDDFGLVTALEWSLNEDQERLTIPIDFAACTVPDTLPPNLSLAFYRVARECLTNISRHAKASHVWVTLSGNHNLLELVVRDDGCGITAPSRTDPTSFGLNQMRERARALGGTLSIISEPGQGTEVRFTAPISGCNRKEQTI